MSAGSSAGAGGELASYLKVCPVDAIDRETGVVALVHGRAVAIFRTYDGEVHALANYDPSSRASVLARGIVGSRNDVPVVASPMYKHAFDLRTGACLDDTSLRVPVFEVAVVDSEVWIGPERRTERERGG